MIKPLRDRHLEPVTDLPRSLRRYESSYDAKRQSEVMMREQTRCEIECFGLDERNEPDIIWESPSGIRFQTRYSNGRLVRIEILTMPINCKSEGISILNI